MSCEQTTSTTERESGFTGKNPSLSARNNPYTPKSAFRPRTSLYGSRGANQTPKTAAMQAKGSAFASKSPFQSKKDSAISNGDNPQSSLCLDFFFEATESNQFLLQEDGGEIILNL